MRKKGYSFLILLLVISLIWPSIPKQANAAGGLGISSANGQNVAGQTATVTLTYEPGIAINLIGSVIISLPAGFTATTADQFNGVNIPSNSISSDGRTVTLSSLLTLNLGASNTFTLNNKVLPAVGSYTFTAYTRSVLNVTIGESTQQNNFTILASTPAPTTGQVSVSNQISGSSTVTVTGQNPGDIITVYNSSNQVLGTGTVNASGTATVTATLVPAGGTISVSAKRGTAESSRTNVTYGAAVLSAIPSSSITVANNYGSQDTVTVNNISAGDLVTVYSGSSSIGTATANASGTAVVSTTLNAEGGTINVSRTRSGVESAFNAVTYSAEVVPPIAAANVSINNAYGGSSTVTVNNLKVGSIVTISSGSTILATGPALTTSLTLPVVLTPTGGSLSVSVKEGLLQSATTTVNYPSITVPAILATNITATNNAGDSDSVTVSGQVQGDTVTVYDSTGVLGTGTVSAQGNVTVPVTLTPLGGSVNVSVTHQGVVSPATAVAYVAEIIPPLNLSQVSLSSIVNGSLNVTVNGLTSGNIVKVYGNGTVLGTATATATGIVTIPVAANAQGGSLSLSVTQNGIESATVSANYGAITVPAVNAANVTITNNSGNNDIVRVTGQTAGNTIMVYGNGSLLGSGTVNSSGEATINVTLNPLGGTAGISVTNQGVESVVLPVAYVAEVVPPVAAASVNVGNNSGNADTVIVSGLQVGDIIKVYGNVSLLGTGTVATGNTSVNIPVTLTPLGGNVNVTLTRNGVESVPTVVTYVAEVVQAINPANVTITNEINVSSLINVTSLQPNDIVNVYADGTLLGTETANGQGVVQLNATLSPTGGAVSLVVERNGVLSLPVLVNYGAVLIPNITAANVTPQNNYGDSDTVTVTGVNEGLTVTIYEDNQVLGSATAPASGTVTIDVTLTPTGGTIYATAKYLGIESDPVAVNYGPEVVPPIDAALVTVANNAGGSDTVSFVSLVAGDLITVYKDGSVLGTGTVSAAGAVVINATLSPQGGTISVTRQHNGIESAAISIPYNSEPGPVLDPGSIAITNATGSNDMIQVTGLELGDTIRVLDANDNVIGTGIANASGTVMFQVTLLPEGGNLTFVLTRAQLESDPVQVNYTAEPAAPVNPPVAVVDSINADIGTVTVTNLQPGTVANVYDDDTTLLGTAPADGAGKATISFKFLKAQGKLFVRTLANGVETTVLSFDYQDIEVDATPGIVTAALTSISGSQGTVTVTGAQAGDILKVYGPNNVVLGTGTADTNGQALIVFTFPNSDGDLRVTTTTNGTETDLINLPYSGIDIPATPVPGAALSNINNDQGTVTATGLQQGDLVTVYGPNNVVLGTSTVGSNGQAVITFSFPTEDGVLTVTSTRNGTESSIVVLPYSGVTLPTTPTPVAALSGINGAQGVVTVTGVAVGQTVRVYSDANVQLAEITADGNGAAVLPFTFPTTDGELSVRTVSNGTETEIAVLPYSNITLPVATPTAALTDITGAQGTVEVNDAQQGDVIKVYGPNNTVLGTAVANSSGQATVVFTFTTAAGDLNVTYTRNGTETAVVTLPYSGVDIPATPQPVAVITNINSNQGTITATGIDPGETVTVYDDNNAVLGTGVAGANGEAVITFTFPTADGTLTVVANVNGVETEVAALPYSGIVIPTTPTPVASISSVNGDEGVVTVTGVTPGQTVRVYSDANAQLAEVTANGSGAAILNITFPNTTGELSVRTVANGTETEIGTLPYSGIVIPSPTPTADLTDINGAQGTVTVSNAQSGDVIKVYGPNNELLGTQSVGANGEATVVFTFTTADGDLTVTYTRGGTETNIVTLPYSGVDIPTTPQPAAIISDIDGADGTVTVTNVAAGQTVRVYSDANVQLAEEVANASGTAVLSFTFPTANGELSVRTVANGTETEIGTLPYSGIVIPSPTPTADLTDINGAQGTVTVSNAQSGDLIKVYGPNNELLGTQSVGSSGEATVVFTFTTADGDLTVTYTRGGTETNIVTLPYSGVDIPTTPQPTAIISDINGAQGTVTVSNVIVGQTVRVYSDTNVQLAEQTANGSGVALLSFTFPNANGELSVRTVANGVETEIGTLPYSGIVIPSPTPTADLTDINGAQGTVTVSNAQSGDVIKVYGPNNELLGTQSVGANGEATVVFTFTTADGDLTVTYTRGGTETNIVTLPYSGVDIPTTPQPAAIISDIDGADGTVTVTNVAAGQTVRVYSDANVQLAEEVANASGTAVLSFTFPTANGELSVRTVANGTETEIGTLPYSGIVIPTPTPTADLTDINGAQGTVTVSNAQSGDVIKVYGPNNELLGTQSVGANGEATVVFTFTTADGDLTVTYTRGGTETNIVTLPYSGVDIPTTPQPTAIISDIDGADGTVTVTNVAAGQTVRVYSDANVQLAEEVANASGTAVLSFTFPTANGELSVRTVANGTETEIGTLPYSGIVIPSPTPTADLTDINGAQGTVTVSNAQSGDVIKVYGPNNELLGTQSVGTNGEATVVFTFTTADGDLTVTYTRGGTETNIVTLPYSGVDIPTTPQPTATISNIDGADGTVTVTNVAAGQTVRVYSDANVQLAEETAGANGTAVLNFTFPNANGELSVRTVANGTETEIATLPYSGIVIPTPTPAAEVTDVNGDEGTVTVTNVAAGQIVRVYSDTNVQLAEETAGANGTAVLSFTFPNANGQLSVRTVANGTETEIATLPYSGIVIPTPTPAADLTDINGAQGTVTVSDAQPGDVINVYGPNNELLGTQNANANGEATVTFTFTTADGDLTVTYTRGGTETTITTLPYSGVDIPTTPEPTPTAQLGTINGAQGSVAVSNVAANEIVRVYDANNTLLQEGTADANGTLQLTFTFQTASGTLSVRTVSNGTETEIATLPYSGADAPTTPGNPDSPEAALVNTQGNQGTVRVNGVLTGDTVTVQSDVYNQGTVQLGNVTVTADGFVDVPVQFPETSGQIVVILNRNGESSTVATLNYSTQDNGGTGNDDDNVPAGRVPGQLGLGPEFTNGGAAGTGTPEPAGETDTPGPTTPAEPTDNNVGAAAGEGTAAGETGNTDRLITLKSTNVADFDDTVGHWAQADIARLHRLGILNGVGGNKYDPNATLTRAQFAQMINNLLQLSSDGSKAGYSDIRSSAWYNNSIQAVTAAGVSNGYTDGTYKPNRKISREEMTHILLNTMRYVDSDGSFGTDTNQVLSTFTDRSQVGNWARDDLASAIAEQLIKGRATGQLAPKANTTRAEAAVTLSRLIDQLSENFKID
ncbi:S-layer homology domain-containing protein [Paenibacillus wenxiniae]